MESKVNKVILYSPQGKVDTYIESLRESGLEFRATVHNDNTATFVIEGEWEDIAEAIL